MSTYVKGDAVTNATSYELLEKTAEGAYTSLAEASEINFELDALGLEAGDHTLVVKAKADGYEDSDASNEVVYTAAFDGTIDISSLFTSTWQQGAMVVDPETTSTYGGPQTNQIAYRCSNTWIDLTQYSSVIESGAKLSITFSRAVNTNHTKYGLIFYSDKDKTAITGTAAMEYAATDFGVYSAETREIDIPSGTKYVKTTWMPEANETELGAVFSAIIVA